ncbi:MAG: beta-ketoacyl-ACP synthase [Hyphomicrobiaceae bacterium]
MLSRREAWVTGLGIVSSLGEGNDAHWQALGRSPAVAANIDISSHAPYTVHPLGKVDIDRLIPSKADRKQMGVWQRLGVHVAGLALVDAGVVGNEQILEHMDLVVAAGNGERDESFDARLLDQIDAIEPREAAAALNTALTSGLRPTLYLGELSNLLAGNIQIVHKVTGSSRTLKGEELAGFSAIEDATRRIAAGQADIVLAGGALNAERDDLLLNYELANSLWAKPFAPVWERSRAGGGFVPGSAAAFLVIEASDHALARGARAYARISATVCNRAQRAEAGDIAASLRRLGDRLPIGQADEVVSVLSGASGVEPATSEEYSFLTNWIGVPQQQASARAYGTPLGHSVEAHFPIGVALACLALERNGFFEPFEGDALEAPCNIPPERILVTSIGHWRGEGLALIERVDGKVAA